MAGFKVIGRRHWREFHFIDLFFFHEDFFVVALTVADALNGFVEVVGGTVGRYVDELDGEVGVFSVGADVKGGFDAASNFDPIFEGLGGVDEDIVAGFHDPLIKGAAFDGVAGTADVAAVAGHGVHGVVDEAVGLISGRS